MRKVWSHIVMGGTLVDFGCDHEQTLVRRVAPYMKKVVGLDIVSKSEKRGNIEIITADLERKVPLLAKSADVITMLAVLEHLHSPYKAVAEAYRILKPGGVFLITVPSPAAEKVLPFLAALGIVRRAMVDQHQHYFTHNELQTMLKKAGFKNVTVENWELGCNTFVKAIK